MASPPSPPSLFLLSFFPLLFLATASAAPTTLKLSLSPFPHPTPSPDPYHILNHLVATSLARAHHLKHPSSKSKTQNPNSQNDIVKTPLSPKSYGGYSISLSFGTPPQTIPFVFDTGSSLVWFPCTSRYSCSQCEFSNINPNEIPTFIPKNSTSSKIIGCQNPKCSWVFGPKVDCSQPTCPPYILQYGLGSTAGILLSDTLVFPNKTVNDFLVGCSILSNRQPAGIAGFGRSPESIPSQMGLKKFSYCLVSRRFDDTPASSDLVLETGSGKNTKGISYTPFHKNPNVTNAAFQEYYYVNLRRIIVGKKPVKIPYKFLEPGVDGSGGSIVDSGTTFTFMERPVFELVAKEFETQRPNYSRAVEVEKLSGLRPCFNISGVEDATVPELVFQFKGGAKMELPLGNYFVFVNGKDVICLTVVSGSAVNPVGGGGGPAIILGSYQQQNYYVEYDLEKERFGFTQKKCA